MSPDPNPPARIPTSLWVLAWSSLASQLVVLAQEGVRTDDVVPVVVSTILGGLVVGWISAGVVRARKFRLVLVLILLVLTTLVAGADLAGSSSVGDAVLALVGLGLSATQVAALLRFRTTDWYAWQRSRPPTHVGPPITGLVAVAVVVGVLGGMVGPVDDGVDVQIRVGGR